MAGFSFNTGAGVGISTAPVQATPAPPPTLAVFLQDREAAQSILASTLTKISYDVIPKINVGPFVVTANEDITFPFAGAYWVRYKVGFDALPAGTDFQANLLFGTDTVFGMRATAQGANEAQVLSMEGTLRIAADEIEGGLNEKLLALRVFQNDVGAQNTSTVTRPELTIYRIPVGAAS